jgi:PAS domain S-box-containing protein
MAIEHKNGNEIVDWTKERLLQEVEQLRLKLDEAEQILQAIRSGDVDALVINGPEGEQVFSLTGAEHVYRVIVETMNEAALTVSLQGVILFCNRRFCELMRTSQETIVGKDLLSFVALPYQVQVKDLVADAEARPIRRLTLLASDGTEVSVQLCASPLASEEQNICLVASDLSELEASVQSVRVLREQQQALEQAQAQLAQRNAELQKANAALDASRRAALNVLEDAVQTRDALRRSQEEQSQLYKFADAVNRTGILSDLYEKALDAMTASLNADRAAILLFDEDSVMRFKAWRGLSEGYRREVEGHSPWEKDTPDPHAFGVGTIEESGLRPSLQSVIQHEGIQALGFVPLMYSGRLLGKVMLYFNRPYIMSDEELDLAQAIAATLALGIERTRSDTRLRESEDRLRAAMEAGEMGAWSIDLTTRAVTWDAKQYELFGRPPHASPGDLEECYRFVHAEDVARVQQAAATAMETGRFSEEFRIIRPDGNVRWIAGQGAVVSDRQGRSVRMVGVNYDITEQKEVQARIERFAEELERKVVERTQELLASQERLRALTTELNLAEQRERQRLASQLHDHLQQTLVLGKLKLGQGKRLVQTIPACTDVMKQVDDVLSEALEYTRSLVADLSPPVLRDHGLAAGLMWLGNYMNKHDIVVTVNVPEHEDFNLLQDQVVLLFQSVRELLINSSKYAGTGQASVTLEQGDSHLRIVVSDNGVGFDLAAAADTPNDGLSSKFGLFSIRERMNALGGSFELNSMPGTGTTATLTLTLGDRAAAASERRAMSEKSGTGESPDLRPAPVPAFSPASQGIYEKPRVRVLLVDDHAMVRQGLRSVLEAYPELEVVGEASDGEEAVAFADRLNPDIVVMDINMPKMNGIDATAQIVNRRPDTVVIGLSVNAGEDNVKAMKKAGTALLITKEAAVQELYRAIQDVLDPKVSTGER